MPHADRFLIIGLDCAAPRFVMGPHAFELPNLQALMRRGCWGTLRSCDPPITVPAWACMMSGKDPGTLGIYGFRNRRHHDYHELTTVNADDVREPRLWDILSRDGKKVVLVGVPLTYPVRPVNGCLVADFLTPSSDAPFTYPKSLKEELARNIGEYLFDVKDFRTERKPWLLEQIHRLMENRFDTAAYLMKSRPWDFCMMVDMGTDRLHHGFWRFCDPQHPQFVPGNAYEHAFRDYYTRIDARIGELLALAGDDTAVMVVSDHGARAMHGGVCVNQWLMDHGYLRLLEAPAPNTRIEDCAIDWAHTTAWSAGGYYARVFLNVAGREPEGVVDPNVYEQTLLELTQRLESMTGPGGTPLGNRVLRPKDVYREVRGVAPDLLVYLGDLDWRAIGRVGMPEVFTTENDTGPDDANHDFEGIFIFADRHDRRGIEVKDVQLLDVAPTVLSYLGYDVPGDMHGHNHELTAWQGARPGGYREQKL